MKTAMQALTALLIMAGCGTGFYFWFEKYQQPIVRADVGEPIYTVDSSAVAMAVGQGKKIVEFGPLPGSAFHAGVLAFKQPEEALIWLKTTGKYDEGWRIFELSGEYDLDTHLVRGLPYTNKTLQINREIAMVP